MKKYLYLPFFLFSVAVFAQQQPQYSQYMLNQYALNPAVGGTEDFAPITFSFRKQWLGVDNSPTSVYLTAHMPLGKVFGDYSKAYSNKVHNYHGVGVALYGDSFGPTSQESFQISYAYNMQLTSQFRLSAGVFLGVKHFAINNSEIDFHDTGDPTAESGGINKIAPDATLGLWGYTNNFYIGLAAHHLLNNKISANSTTNDPEYTSRLNRHFFLTGGIKLPVSENLVIVPSVMFKYVTPSPISVDFNIKFLFQEQYWIGATARTRDGIGLFAGVNFSTSWAIGYSYEYTTSKIRPFQTGSHEILLAYKLPIAGSVICPSKFW